MANVNITEPLRMMIKRNVCKPFFDRYVAKGTLSVEDSYKFYRTHMVTSEQQALLEQLPSDWKSITRSENFKQKIHIAHNLDPKSRGVERHWLQLQMPADTPIYYPYSWTYTPSADVTNPEQQNSAWFRWDLSTVNPDIDYLADLTAICTERDTMVATIEKILDGCKTLNQVQKIWPAITKYVDADIIERMNRKVVRKTAENLNLDPEAMQALSVHHIRQQMVS